VVLAKDSYLREQDLLQLTARDLGDDPVFGFMNNYALDEFFAADRFVQRSRACKALKDWSL